MSEVEGMNAEFVERIELKIAYLERANNDLSEVVYRQQQEIDALRAELGSLDVDSLSPREALETLYRLKGLAADGG